MKSVLSRFILIFAIVLAAATSAKADVAVLIGITDDSVTLHRVERSESYETAEQARSDALLKLRALPLVQAKTNHAPNSLQIEWYDQNGTLVHQESRPDPRFIHAPGGQDAVLPETMVLLRAPATAVEIRV